MSTSLRHNLDHDPAVVETMLDFCRAVQKTGAASLRDGANGHLVNFGEGETARVPDKNDMDKTERIRLKNRRAQQKLRDRMRQDVEVLETALEDCEKARLAMQLERRELESQFSAGLHALTVKGMFPVLEGILCPQRESNGDDSWFVSSIQEMLPASTDNGALDDIVNGIPDAEAALCVFSKEQRKLNELSISGRLIEKQCVFEQIRALFWFLAQRKPYVFSELLSSGQQRPSEAQGIKSYEVIAREINLSMSEEKSIKKLLHGFSLDLKKWTMTMEWSSTELIRNNNNDDNLEVCFANSSWNEYAILERACSGAQSRLTFAVLKLFAEIQKVISSEKFAYIWALSPTVIPDVLAICHSLCSRQPGI